MLEENEPFEELLVRVGRLNPKYPDRSNNPYWYNEWVSLNRLKAELLKMARFYHSSSPSSPPYKEFPWYLMLLEFVPRSRKDFWYPWKYIGIWDIDCPAHIPVYSWSTGRKGFRVLLLEEDGEKTARYLLPSSSGDFIETIRRDTPDYFQRFRGGEFTDTAILIPGHGTKVDCFPHPKTGNWPVLQSISSPMLLSSSLKPENPYKIAMLWTKVLDSIQSTFLAFSDKFQSQARPTGFILPPQMPHKKQISSSSSSSQQTPAINLSDLPQVTASISAKCIQRKKTYKWRRTLDL
jgi:hypothetical protein